MVKVIQMILLVAALVIVVLTLCSCGSYTKIGNCKYYKQSNLSSKGRLTRLIGF